MGIADANATPNDIGAALVIRCLMSWAQSLIEPSSICTRAARPVFCNIEERPMSSVCRPAYADRTLPNVDKWPTINQNVLHRINVHELYEVQYRTHQFGCTTKAELEKVAHAVGTGASAVEKHFMDGAK